MPWLGFLRGIFLANHLTSTDNLTKQPKDRTHTNNLNQQYKKVALISNNTMKNYTKTKIDRARFSHLLRHLVRKWRRSILTTPEPTQDTQTDRSGKTTSSSACIAC